MNRKNSLLGGYTAEFEQPIFCCSSGCYDLDLCFEAYISLFSYLTSKEGIS